MPEMIRAATHDVSRWVSPWNAFSSYEICIHIIEKAQACGMLVTREIQDAIDAFKAAQTPADVRATHGLRFPGDDATADTLYAIVDNTIMWMNDHVAPPGYRFILASGLELRPH